MIFSNKVYDILKWFCIILLPALASFVRAVFPLWSIPYAEPISATIVAVSACLGACLCISNAQYQGNDAEVHKDAYEEMIKQNNEMRDELAMHIENTFESFPEDDM